MKESVHVPVLLRVIIDYIVVKKDGVYFDATLDGANMARAILPKLEGNFIYAATDRDANAVENAKHTLAGYGDKVKIFNRNFCEVDEILKECGRTGFDGMLADLGISSDQLEDGARGFSFNKEGDLDMRFDQNKGEPLRELLRKMTEREIADVIYNLGQERLSFRIARGIARAVSENKMSTSKDLAAAVVAAYPPKLRHGRIHCATKTFGGFRKFVNDESGSLEKFLAKAYSLLNDKGRLLVISFESIDDAITKKSMREAEAAGFGKILTKKPITPSEEESKQNPRCRTAKLRVFERRIADDD